MDEREHVVAAVIDAAGGEITGRVRLQKIVYILDQLGLNSNFRFDYHHYGPFSRDLDNATADAKAFGLIEEKFDFRKSDGARYSIFRLKEDGQAEAKAFDKLGSAQLKELAQKFAETNVTVLELAATVDWLCRYEKCADWRREIEKRKGIKVQGGRLEKAIALLRDLDLPPSAGSAAA